MATGQPDIVFTSVKLSQSNSTHAKHHYHGLKHAIRYLYSTWTDSIYFWHTQPHTNSLTDRSHPSTATAKTSFLTIDLIITLPSLLLLATWTGPLVSRKVILSVASAFNWQAAQLSTKLNFTSCLPCQLPKPSSWWHARLEESPSLYAAYYGTSRFPRKQPL